jgi:hypothetical protein
LAGVAVLALTVSIVAAVQAIAAHKKLRAMARIIDQVTGNTRQLDVMANDVRTIKLALPAEIARQSEIATDALRDVREALNDLSERHNDLRHDFDTMAAGRATNSNVEEFRVRLDLTENAARQAQARIGEIAEQLERVEEHQNRH